MNLPSTELMFGMDNLLAFSELYSKGIPSINTVTSVLLDKLVGITVKGSSLLSELCYFMYKINQRWTKHDDAIVGENISSL